MISSPTVFVLGAGASMPYGFPSGYQLVSRIIKEYRRGGISFDGWGRGFASLGPQFIEAIEQSGRLSIDAFLEHRKDFRDIGKIAIAAALIPFEDPAALYARDNKKDWYPYISKHLNCPIDDFTKNNVTFVTYNYDRSLEHFLTRSLVSTFNIAPEQAKELVEKKIIHLHGTLGPYSTERLKPKSREYSSVSNDALIELAAKHINIIHEGDENDPRLDAARLALEKAERICFLGFGYDELTVSRLRPPKWATSGKTIYGGCYGMTRMEVKRVRKMIPYMDIDPNHAEFDCVRVLREAFEVM